MKRYFALLISPMILLTFIGSTPVHADPAKSKLILHVTLITPGQRHLIVDQLIVANQPFEVVVGYEDVANHVSGTMGKPVQGKYSLRLFISEARGEGFWSNTSNYNLVLDKPVHMSPKIPEYSWTVLLSQALQ